jgi:GT2 family glycosyltransferase
MDEYSNAHPHISFIEKNETFNFSSICNYGVANACGEYVVLLNNDIQIKSADWLKCLLEHAQRKDVGAVGGKLFFADGRIQHAGVVAGMHGVAGHSHQYFAPDDIGYFGSLMLTREVSAVTGAMLMVSRAKYLQVSGLDADNLAVAFSDVDLCLKLLSAGYRNIFTPYAQAIHFESASRGYEDTPEKLLRLQREQRFFVNKWQDFLAEGDKYFNPNFDLDCYDYSLKL